MSNTALHHFAVCVGCRVQTVSFNTAPYEKFYHTMAETAEQAQIKVNKALLKYFDIAVFPEHLYADLAKFDQYKTPNPSDAEHTELHGLIRESEELSNDDFPISDGVIQGVTCDLKPESAVKLSEQGYTEMRELVTFIEVE